MGLPAAMTLNPAFLQWRQLAQAWQAENSKRRQDFLAACQLLKDDAAGGLRIDIEADSTVAADEQAEKAARSEFLQSLLPMLQLLLPQVQANPAIAPLIKSLTMFGMHAFPAARDLEDDFEQAFRALATTPPGPPPPPKGNVKSPAEIAAETAIAKGDQQVDAARVQVEGQKNATDMMKAYADAAQQQAKMQQDAQFRAAELALAQETAQSRQQLETARLAHPTMRDSARLV
jgi:hypothetical protein